MVTIHVFQPNFPPAYGERMKFKLIGRAGSWGCILLVPFSDDMSTESFGGADRRDWPVHLKYQEISRESIWIPASLWASWMGECTFGPLSRLAEGCVGSSLSLCNHRNQLLGRMEGRTQGRRERTSVRLFHELSFGSTVLLKVWGKLRNVRPASDWFLVLW